MDVKDYTIVCDSVSQKISTLKFNIAVYDIAVKTKYILNTPKIHSKKSFTIVFDKNTEDTPMNHPDNFYCTNIKDLVTVINFVCDHPDLYIEQVKEFNSEICTQ